MTQDYVQGSPTVICANGHPCNQYVTNCRICGAVVKKQPYQSPQQLRVTQDGIQRSPTVICANGHPCNQFVTTCRTCGAPVTNQPYQPPERHEPTPASQPPAPGAYEPAATVYRGPLPSVWPTVLITFLFGIFGLIPASINTTRARDTGRPTNTYWAAFGWTMAASILLWVLFLIVITAAVRTKY